ncbi:MAG TPA: hypothetical protein VFW65_22475 [Pseudonocardiaceae bacterium]|nr:hypothetical protein [Pseudonocardiaceae bacterium]
MRRHVIRTLLVGGAVAAAVALVAGQASANGTVTISGAGAAFSTSSTNAVLQDVTTGLSFSCVSLGVNGSLANVTSAALPFTTTQVGGAPHSIVSANCSTSGTAVTPVLPWDIVITATSATPPQASGFVQGASASGLLFRVSMLTCSFGVAGQADFTWTNVTGNQLKFTGSGTLHPVGVSSGCFGLISSSDVMTFTGTFGFSPSSVTIGP